MFRGSAGRLGHSEPPADGPGCAADDGGTLEAATETDEVCSPAEDL